MLTWFSAALLLPFLFLLFFFFDCTTLHSLLCCSRGSDGKWVVMVLRANATGSCLGRASGVSRPPLRLSSMALMKEGPSSSTFFSRAARRSLPSFCPLLGGRPDSSVETPRREHTRGALIAIVASSFRRASFSFSSASLPRVPALGCYRRFQSSW
jgi:hypothetical protein